MPQDSQVKPLADRVALVTGAAHGQGRATALALARAGAHIVALDVGRPLAYPGYQMGTAGELDALADDCRGLASECLAFAADVRDDAAVTAAVSAAVAQWGRIDILFNNAGICGYGLAHELTEEAWDAMIDINLEGCVDRCTSCHSAHDRPAIGRDHQQLVDCGLARHGATESLCRVEMGIDGFDQILGHRAGAA